jgi:integrase
MLKRMSSSRLRSAHTLKAYAQTGVTFFTAIGGIRAPTEQDWHDYFMVRRRQGISDRTLTMEFSILKKLADTNHYRWPFTKDDTPRSRAKPYTPILTPSQAEQMIKAWPLYSTTERFYLACATVWGLRSGELSAIHKRDFNAESVLIHKEKREESVRRLIPDELKALFLAVKPTMNNDQTASDVFARICTKAKIERQRRQSWHSIRHCLTGVLDKAIARSDLSQSLLGEWMGWSKARIGETYGGSAMVGIYRDSSGGSEDPFWLDRQILPIHPFLKLWKGVTPKEKTV